MARTAIRKAVSSPPAIANHDEQLGEVVMTPQFKSVHHRVSQLFSDLDDGEILRICNAISDWLTQSHIDINEIKIFNSGYELEYGYSELLGYFRHVVIQVGSSSFRIKVQG